MKSRRRHLALTLCIRLIDRRVLSSLPYVAAPHPCNPVTPRCGVLALQIPPVTRIFMYLLVLITAVDCLSGEAIDAGSTFSLDWGRTFKVTIFGWRLLLWHHSCPCERKRKIRGLPYANPVATPAAFELPASEPPIPIHARSTWYVADIFYSPPRMLGIKW